jgi:hypothetical protein
MDPQKNDHPEPKAGHYDDPFSELRTIPSGWDVSAFSSSEPNVPGENGRENYLHTGASETNDKTQNTL